jgi:membrane protein
MSIPERWRRLAAEVRALSPRDLAVELIDRFRDNGLLLDASSIAFRAALASIPLTLFALGLLGFLGLSELWTAQLGPQLATAVSPPAFTLIDETVTQVLGEGKLFWITLGLAVTVWQVSNAVRALMHSLNTVYQTKEERPLWKEVGVSILLGLAAIAAILAAIAAAQGIPALVRLLLGEGVFAGIVGFALGWLAVLVLLGLAVGLLLRVGPDESRPLGWVTFGTLLVVLLWVIGSLAFAFYITSIADYASVFGALATGFIALEYLYLSALTLLAGVQVDAIVREHID